MRPSATRLRRPGCAAAALFREENRAGIGERLGVSEDAAQKRVARALDQLRGLFHHRGVAVTASALAGVLSVEAVHAAPAALAASVTGAALTMVGSSSTAGLVNLMASATERTRVFFHTLTGDGTEVPSSFEMIKSEGQWKPVLSMGWRYPKEPSSFYTSPVFGPAIDLER